MQSLVFPWDFLARSNNLHIYYDFIILPIHIEYMKNIIEITSLLQHARILKKKLYFIVLHYSKYQVTVDEQHHGGDQLYGDGDGVAG